jgi:hypothetical protein
VKILTDFEYNVVCGVCDSNFKMLAPPEHRDGATMNCPDCNALLLGLADGSTVDFHAHLNATSEGLWPANGNETACVTIE